LKQIRSDKGMSRLEVSVRSGISSTVLEAIERFGYVVKRPDVRRRLAAALDTSEDTLFPAQGQGAGAPSAS
jgi:transcriptional regulator with XRE-family HTH domain